MIPDLEYLCSVQTLNHIERSINNSDWIFLILFGSLIILALVRYFFSDRFNSFIQLPISNKYFLIAAKESLLAHPFTMLLFLINMVVTAIFGMLVLHYLVDSSFTIGLPLFFQTLAGLVGFVLVRLFAEKLVGIVFGIETLVNQYLFEKLSYHNFLALFLGIAAIVFLWMFNKSILVLCIALGTVIVGYTISLIASLKSNEKLIFTNFFYFILYLCALEISPFILAYKMVT